MHLGYLFRKNTDKWSVSDIKALSSVYNSKLGYDKLSEEQTNKLSDNECYDSSKLIYIRNRKQFETLYGIVKDYNGTDTEFASWVSRRGRELDLIEDTSDFTLNAEVLADAHELVQHVLDEEHKKAFTDDQTTKRATFIQEFIVDEILKKNPTIDEIKVNQNVERYVSSILSEHNDNDSIGILLTHAVNIVLSEI